MKEWIKSSKKKKNSKIFTIYIFLKKNKILFHKN
jgi:hypothetical protein